MACCFVDLQLAASLTHLILHSWRAMTRPSLEPKLQACGRLWRACRRFHRDARCKCRTCDRYPAAPLNPSPQRAALPHAVTVKAYSLKALRTVLGWTLAVGCSIVRCRFASLTERIPGLKLRSANPPGVIFATEPNPSRVIFQAIFSA